jgi:hypothetical protein
MTLALFRAEFGAAVCGRCRLSGWLVAFVQSFGCERSVCGQAGGWLQAARAASHCGARRDASFRVSLIKDSPRSQLSSCKLSTPAGSMLAGCQGNERWGRQPPIDRRLCVYAQNAIGPP